MLEKESILQGKQVDIVAHSMGGLVARIYIQEMNGAPRVKRLINLAVPMRGSANALAELSDGWGGFQNFLAGGINTIRRVMFSFPSLYELFPSYDRCCRIGNEENYDAFDPTDAKLWKAGDWLPAEYRDGVRLQRFEESLESARRIRTTFATDLPSHIEQITVAGDRFATNLYLYVDSTNRSWTKWRFKKDLGDGTVPLWSAAGSGGVSGALPAFADHATIFDDGWVTDLLRRKLDKGTGDMPVKGPVPRAITRAGATVGIELVTASFDQSVVGAGQEARLTVIIEATDPLFLGDLVPQITIHDSPSPVAVEVNDMTTENDLRRRSARFAARIRTVDPGVYSFRTDIPGLGTYTSDLVAMP
jgi:pimeloyl-ACP methyl ester carboxylesterase